MAGRPPQSQLPERQPAPQSLRPRLAACALGGNGGVHGGCLEAQHRPGVLAPQRRHDPVGFAGHSLPVTSSHSSHAQPSTATSNTVKTPCLLA